MKVTAVETIRPRLQANLCFVRLHTDDGLTGLGESFFGARTVESYIHETVAPLLLGLDDPSPQAVATMLTPYVGYQGGGAEQRGNGAIDVALWDLVGKQTGLPLARLLGGPVRDRIPTYNTCAGVRYVSTTTSQNSANWGLPTSGGAYEDLYAFLHEPARLARELWDEGIRGMKIWPFDEAAEASNGTDIPERALAAGLDIVAAIRAEVGFEMNLMIELHGLWTRTAAAKIARALTEYRPYWIEDPLRPDAVDALGSLRAEIDVPIATGETCIGRRGFLPLFQRGAVDIATLDIGWTGGITEAVKIASLADAYTVPIAPHDCTGPVSLAVATHVVCSQPNGLVQETARSFIRTWYADLVEGLPSMPPGEIVLPTTPGHGITLRDDLGAAVQSSRL
ncbi:L-alanine-DL-glutamate epimerase-like enolase superfamily enzyme [Kribbella antiqua]|uniref:L-alanine-DL-glutamate epimerase-like enolase superfamily enzyme n=1 Tax=Kribbella antiqua TaxID=2512217 RepID=A0A4R2IV87_9ACTN|nr:mandelate racemase/muconate lactonizing enzyme family protein [Kribbella antiqua]TCO49501.1 L-alanine-DL-glutamate epimerase-like enolase superfamily enzyme [Kribbella antiqua]